MMEGTSSIRAAAAAAGRGVFNDVLGRSHDGTKLATF